MKLKNPSIVPIDMTLTKQWNEAYSYYINHRRISYGIPKEASHIPSCSFSNSESIQASLRPRARLSTRVVVQN